MQTILPPSGNTIKILGKARSAEHGLRWMHYVLAQPVEGGVLVFHTLTRALLLLTPEEYAAPDNLPELRDGWFRVPQEMDDMKYADQVRFIRRTMWKEPEHITSYTIFTTTDCNARCFYCYEMGRSRIPMSAETAHKAAASIMCFKVKFAANPLKSLVDRPCNRSPRDSHIICNFLVGLTEDELLMDQPALLLRQNLHHCMKCFLLNDFLQHIDRAVCNLAPIFRYSMIRNAHITLTCSLAFPLGFFHFPFTLKQCADMPLAVFKVFLLDHIASPRRCIIGILKLFKHFFTIFSVTLLRKFILYHIFVGSIPKQFLFRCSKLSNT